MGTAIVGGMLLSTVLNLFFIPVLYVLLLTLLGKFSRKTTAAVVPVPPDHRLPPPHAA